MVSNDRGNPNMSLADLEYNIRLAALQLNLEMANAAAAGTEVRRPNPPVQEPAAVNVGVAAVRPGVGLVATDPKPAVLIAAPNIGVACSGPYFGLARATPYVQMQRNVPNYTVGQARVNTAIAQPATVVHTGLAPGVTCTGHSATMVHTGLGTITPNGLNLTNVQTGIIAGTAGDVPNVVMGSESPDESTAGPRCNAEPVPDPQAEPPRKAPRLETTKPAPKTPPKMQNKLCTKAPTVSLSNAQLESPCGTLYLNEKILVRWDVNFDPEAKTARSPTFWQSGASEWCMELAIKDQFLQLSYHLLSLQWGANVKSKIEVALTRDGTPPQHLKTDIVTLKEKEQVTFTTDIPALPARFTISSDLTIFWERSEHHKSSLLHTESHSLDKDLATFLQSGELTDFVLRVGDYEFKTHKALLAARSPVFATMLAPDSPESLAGRVTLTDIDPEIMELLITYMYTGRVPRITQLADRLLLAAIRYDLEGLKELCERELCKQLTVERAAATAVIALKYSCGLLKSCAISFIKKNFALVLGSQGWATAVKENPDLIIEISKMMSDQPAEK